MQGEVFFCHEEDSSGDLLFVSSAVKVYDIFMGVEIPVPLRPPVLNVKVTDKKDCWTSDNNELYIHLNKEDLKKVTDFYSLMSSIMNNELDYRHKIIEAVKNQTKKGIRYTSAKREVLYAICNCSLTECQYMAEILLDAIRDII